MTSGLRKLFLSMGFARGAILLVLVLVMIPAVAMVSAADHPSATPSPTGSSFARAYSVPYSYSVAESISQASSGGFVVGALCSAAAVATPNCNLNDSATVLRVDSTGNIQSQTQYSYGNGPQSTALNVIKATSDGGAIFAGQPQFGCLAQNLNCGLIVKVDSTGKVQWAKD